MITKLTETADTAKPFGFSDALRHTCTIYNDTRHDIGPSLNHRRLRADVADTLRKDELA